MWHFLHRAKFSVHSLAGKYFPSQFPNRVRHTAWFLLSLCHRICRIISEDRNEIPQLAVSVWGTAQKAPNQLHLFHSNCTNRRRGPVTTINYIHLRMLYIQFSQSTAPPCRYWQSTPALGKSHIVHIRQSNETPSHHNRFTCIWLDLYRFGDRVFNFIFFRLFFAHNCFGERQVHFDKLICSSSATAARYRSHGTAETITWSPPLATTIKH